MLAAPADPDKVNPAIYQSLGSFEQVSTKFNKMLQDYNDDEAGYLPMNLVLFNDALDHLTKIHRIIRFPNGHALLVGYGGSGKQSLSRLAAYVAGYKPFGITLSRGYREKEFREDLRGLYERLASEKMMFLFTDSHVVEEGFLELINNMLTIGMVPALFDEEGKKSLIDKVRAEAKAAGVQETKDELWNYYLDKVKGSLHIILAMSPAGE